MFHRSVDKICDIQYTNVKHFQIILMKNTLTSSSTLQSTRIHLIIWACNSSLTGPKALDVLQMQSFIEIGKRDAYIF